MTLPLDRSELLSRWEGWREFAEAPAIEQPERRSMKELKSLGDEAREEYAFRREIYHSNFLVKTPQNERLNTRLWDLVDANQQRPDRVKGAAVVDSPPGHSDGLFTGSRSPGTAVTSTTARRCTFPCAESASLGRCQLARSTKRS